MTEAERTPGYLQVVELAVCVMGADFMRVEVLMLRWTLDGEHAGQEMHTRALLAS